MQLLVLRHSKAVIFTSKRPHFTPQATRLARSNAAPARFPAQYSPFRTASASALQQTGSPTALVEQPSTSNVKTPWAFVTAEPLTLLAKP